MDRQTNRRGILIKQPTLFPDHPESPPSNDTYTVSTWDHEEDDWKPEFTGLTKWQVRKSLRQLYGHGWTDIGIQVKAETHDREAARWGRGFVARTILPKSISRQRAEAHA